MCKQKSHAYNAVVAAVVLHVIVILLSFGTLLTAFLVVNVPLVNTGSSRRPIYQGGQTLVIGALSLAPAYLYPTFIFTGLGMLLALLASVFIGLRACRLRRSLLLSTSAAAAQPAGGSSSKGCHTRVYTTLLLSLFSTLCIITGSCVVWAAVLPASAAFTQLGYVTALGPGDSCAALALAVSIAATILEGVTHCCCKVRASPAGQPLPSAKYATPVPEGYASPQPAHAVYYLAAAAQQYPAPPPPPPPPRPPAAGMAALLPPPPPPPLPPRPHSLATQPGQP